MITKRNFILRGCCFYEQFNRRVLPVFMLRWSFLIPLFMPSIAIYGRKNMFYFKIYVLNRVSDTMVLQE